MFSGILTVRNDEEWMQKQKPTLTLEESIETRGNAFKETCSPRVPVELSQLTYIQVHCGNWRRQQIKLEVKASKKSGSEVIELPIRGYLAHNARA